MSANNQTLIKEFRGKWYVFLNVMAETWEDEDGNKNEISLKKANGVFNTRDEAFENAIRLTNEEDLKDGIETEYGVQFSRLCKDDSEVNIIP